MTQNRTYKPEEIKRYKITWSDGYTSDFSCLKEGNGGVNEESLKDMLIIKGKNGKVNKPVFIKRIK
jgi:hypothetical protein